MTQGACQCRWFNNGAWCQWVGENIKTFHAFSCARGCEHTYAFMFAPVRRVVHSHAFFISVFTHFFYIFTHGFLNTSVFQLESLCSADSFPFGCEWSLTSSLICESYLNEHMYGSKVHFSFCVIASLKHFCTNWSAAWNNPLDFKYYGAPLFTKQSYCHSCLLIVWKGCFL